MEATKATSSSSSSSSPPLPLLTRVVIKLISAVTDAASRRNGTVNRRLLSFLNYASPANPKPIKGVSSVDITLDPTRNLWFRLFVPTVDHENLPVIVFFHGGGFAFLSPDNKPYDVVCRRFARTLPAVVVSVNYRLSPEHRYPAQYDDGYDVLKFLDGEKNEEILPENADVSRCFVAGDSAGANLAHHLALRAGDSPFRKLKLLDSKCQFICRLLGVWKTAKARQRPLTKNIRFLRCLLVIGRTFSLCFLSVILFFLNKVIGVISIQPFFGGEERTEAEIKLAGIDPLVSTERTDWLWKAYLPPGEGMNRDHEVINVSGPRAVDISKKEFPATLLVVGGFDSLKDWQKRYCEYLKRSGKEVQLLEYPNMVHAFYIFPELKESADLISEVKDFVHRKC